MRPLIGVVLLLLSPCLWADDASRFEAKFNAIQTMHASFEQTVFSKGQAKHTSSGTMALHRPGQFRWETKEPMEQVIVADGKRLWVYDKLLEQVTVRKQNQITDHSAALFLSTEEGSISKTYRVVSTTKAHRIQYDLFSKSTHTDFKHVIFAFQGAELVQLELFDALGQQTRITFHHIDMNTVVKPSWFSFKPPQGVDVMDESGVDDSA